MKKNYILLFSFLFSFTAVTNAQRFFIRDANLTSSHLEDADKKNIELVNNEEGDIIADVFAPRRAPAATTKGIMKNSTPQYVDVQKAADDNCFNVYIKTNYSGNTYTGFVIKNVNFGSNTAIGGAHSFSSPYSNCTESDNWFCQAYGNPQTYIDNPYGTIKFTYQSMGSDGYPIYRVQIYNCYGYTYNSSYGCVNWRNQGVVFEFDKTLSVHPYACDASSRIDFTDYYDGMKIITTDIDSYIDNTGANADWQYWLFDGHGIGADCKGYNFTIKYKSSTTLGSFATSLADPEVTSLYQGNTKIEWSSVETTVEEYKTGNYLLTATFIGKNGNKYVVTADYADECVVDVSGDTQGETQGNAPCTAYFTLDQMSMASQTTLGNALCNADWKTPNGWSKTFTVLQASNSNGENVKLFFSNISTQTYNSVLAPVARDYAFATVDLAQDYDYLAETSCFSFIGHENLYYYGFNLDMNDTYTGQWYDHSNVALGQGDAYIGSNAYFPGANSDPVNDYIDPGYHTNCPYWSTYTCPDGEPYYFNSTCVVHVEQKADGNVLIQVRDKDDASTVYVQIGTTTVEQGGTEGGESTSTPTIKFDTYVNGRGSVTVTPEQCFYVEGAEITLTPVAEEGWTFTGWTGTCKDQITDNGNGTYTFTVPAQDCAVIANFEESIGYTLTWDFNGGVTTSQDNEYTHGKIPEGEFIVAPADPTLDGYQFAGWLNSVTNVVETAEAGMMPSLMPDEDLTYIAQWTANACAYTVHFDSNGGSGTMADQEITCGETTKLNPNKFIGPELTVTYDYHGATSGDDEPSATVYKPFGVWEDNVVEELHDDEEEINYSVSNGATVTMTAQWNWYPSITLPTPEKTGYTFNGWYTEETGGTKKGEGGASFNPAGDITLHAQWTANTYTVTFQDTEADGGHVWWSSDFAYGETPVYGGTETPAKADDSQYSYEFAGWKDVDGVEYPTGTALPEVEGEATYYAMYNQTVLQYTLTWNVNGGDNLMGDYTQGDVEWGTAIIAPEEPTKEGYQFGGWVSSITNEVEIPSVMPAANLTYTAQWTANTYTVHFDSNHGEAADEMGDQTFTYDVEQALTANGFDWTGHTFQGWATEANGCVVYTDQQTVSNLTTENNATVNLYAVWETNYYTVTFQDTEADGGHVWWSSDFAYDETPVYGGENEPSKAGDSQYSYEFAGWKDVDGVEYPMGSDLPAVTAEATYYAMYNQTVLQYTLTWDVNDGDALTGDYTQGAVEWGTPITTPDDPTKEGYQFVGWVSSITNEVEIPSVMPAANLTYTAQWTANTYTVHFDSNHGEAADEMGDQTFTYDVEQALTANGFDWTGHTFQGWATEANGCVVYTDQQTVSNLTTENNATVNLYAVWETNYYTVTFQDTQADGGHVWWSSDFAYGETPVYGGENQPSKESTDEHTYTFTGWTDGVNEYPVGTPLLQVTDNAVYYAVYSESDVLFTVRFENPDGTELQTYQLPLGATPAYEGTPAQENEGDEYNYYLFTFTGWVDGDDNAYGTNDALPAVTGNITYTAQYSKQLFIILQEQKDDDYYTEFSEKYSGERATNATLVRQFGQGKWATLCLPFNVSKALMTAVGLQNRVYEFKYTKGDTQSGITLYFALASKMEAGKGYIVNANAVLAQKKQLVFYSVLVDTKADIQSGYDISALSGYNSEGNIYLVGTLRRGVLYGDQGNGNYYLGLSNNKIFAANSTTGTNVLAYRGIFRSTEPISAPRVRIVAEGEDGEIVGELEVVNGELEEVAGTRKYVQDGILYIERDGIRYSAQGQRLD